MGGRPIAPERPARIDRGPGSERGPGFERRAAAPEIGPEPAAAPPAEPAVAPRPEQATKPAAAESAPETAVALPAEPSNGEHKVVDRRIPRPAPEPPRRDPVTRAAPSAASPPMPASAVPANGEDAMVERGATAPQLRRFIKSRAYVPMHELRRRFAINGGDDDVTVVELDRQRVYVGLPDREGRLLGELLRGGDIGYELSLDPISPIVVGVYPMRPVTRA